METSVRQAMRAMKNTVMQFSEIEVKIREATSNDPWGPSSTILAEISRATNNYEDYPKLFHQLWKRLNDTEHVMHVQKALIVVDYLLRNGAERFINDCKRRARDIAQLKKYKHYDTNNQDDAKECRARAKAVYDLLMDDGKIAEERGKAARIRDVRLQGFGGGAELHVAGANEMVSPNDRRYNNEDENFDDRRDGYKPPKSAEKPPSADGDGAASADGDKKKKKKKKKEKKEDGEEDHVEEKEKEGEDEKNGKDEEKKEKKVKKPKKKKVKEGENGAAEGDRPAGASFADSSASFGHEPFPASKAVSSAAGAADPFASSSSAASAYAAMALAGGPATSPASNDDIFNQLARPDAPVNRSGDVDLMTGFGGSSNGGGEDLTHVFSASLDFSGGDSSSSSSAPVAHKPKPVHQSDQAAEVFGRKRSDLWESDLLNVDNIKDTESKKKNNQPKEQQMTMGMMRSIQPLGSAPPKINNADKRSGIVPSTPSSQGAMYNVATPASTATTPIGMMTPMGVATPMGMAPVAISPVGVGMAYPMGMQPVAMAPLGMAQMGMAAAPMMHSPMAAGYGAVQPLGYAQPRSAAGPNSATNDIFFR